ncbi:14393_t:CDS:2, partial [Acaulospora colombiana]
LCEAIEEIVFMGGGVGIGNRSAVAAEAAQIVLDCPVKKIMIPLNVTHTCIFTSDINRRLLSGSEGSQEDLSSTEPDPTATQGEMPKAATPLLPPSIKVEVSENTTKDTVKG